MAGNPGKILQFGCNSHAIEQGPGAVRNQWRNGHRQLRDADIESRKDRLHPLRIGLFQGPGRLRIDIGVAGKYRTNPSLCRL